MKILNFLFIISFFLLSGCIIGKKVVNSVTSTTPSISISNPSSLDSSDNSLTFSVNYSNVDSVTLQASDVSLVTTGTLTGTVSVSGTGNSNRSVKVSGVTGTGTLGITIAKNSAYNAKQSKYTSEVSSSAFNLQRTYPTLTLSAPSLSTTATTAVSYTVSFTDAATIALSLAQITINKTGTATATATITGTGTSTRTITLTNISGNGTLGINIASGAAVSSDGTSSDATASSTTFVVDNTAPTLTVSSPSSSATTSGPITYTLTYSGASSVLLASSMITLNKTGTANAVVSVSGSGVTTRTVTLTSITGEGTIGISVAANSAIDAAGNYSLASSASTTFSIDQTAPSVSVSAPSVAGTKTGPVTFTVTYSGAITVSLTSAMITLNTTGTAQASTIAISGTGATTRTVTITGITGDGTIGISVNAGSAVDSSGNQALASAASTTFIVDNTIPTISISAPSSTITKTTSVVYTITASGNSALNLSTSNISLTTTGTVTATATVSGSGIVSRTVTLSGISGNGTVAITVAAGVATDDYGNTSLTQTSAIFTIDNTAPTITLSAPTLTTTTTGPVSYVVTYSEASNISLTSSYIVLNKSGTASGTVTISGSGSTQRTVTISSITGDGALGISIASASATDLAGNVAGVSSDSTTFTVANDPLFLYSWHLDNTGQTAFSTGAATAGIDLNLMSTWAQGYLGQGIKVLISDVGVQSAHEDISGNFLTGVVSKDFTNGSSPDFLYATAEPILSTSDPSQAHGTAVAGLIAGVGGNGKGGIGIAPSAKIASANFLNSTTDTTATLAQVSGSFNIINQSWGMSQCTTAAESAISTYIAKLKNERKVYVKAAGNSFSQSLATCSRTSVYRHGNAVFDTYNNNPYTIIVAAANASGIKSSYSSPGSNVWITGLGGEYGTSSPALLTTDLSGCVYGFSPTYTYNSFQLASHVLNSSCNYTSIMNGTSAAAPTVSGVIALLLSANSSLTTRDIKHILASTATKIDSTAAATSNQYVSSPSGHVWQLGWITNAAGFHFHNYYGFGLINTDAAVAMAKNSYSLLGSELQTGYVSSGTLSLSIPDNSATGVTSTISIATSMTIEGVQIMPSVTHTNIGQVGIELTSPSGTKSILINVNNALDGLADYSGEVMLSNAFYGEPSQGNWTIKVIDGTASTTGTLTGWSINIIGH